MANLSMCRAATLSAAALLLGPIGARASGPPTTFKCSAAQIKCANAKATALLGCHHKAEGTGASVDAACLDKADQKFTLPATGCMEKAEQDLVQAPCSGHGPAFIATIENKVDAFVLDVVIELDPIYPVPVASKCSAGKKKCMAIKVKHLLGCYGKAAGKNLPVDPTCLQKAKDKFDGGSDPTKGCFAKLYAKMPNDCPTPIDTAAMEAKADAFALDVYNEIAPPTILDFTNVVPAATVGTCGHATDGSNAVVQALTCGGLDIGGGNSAASEAEMPDGFTSRFSLDCDSTGACQLGPVLTAGPNFDCTATGCQFGAPLGIVIPDVAGALNACAMNSWSAPASGTVNLSTGAASINVALVSDVYLTGNLSQPCPVCRSGGQLASGSPSNPATGLCDRGPRATMACTSTNGAGLTRDCPTGGVGPPPLDCQAGVPGHDGCVDGVHVGPMNIALEPPYSPLTTGTSSRSDGAGLICPGQGLGNFGQPGCFGHPTCRTITENGVPAGALTPGIPAEVTLASAFCFSPTNSASDGLYDLPGPGALSLRGIFNAHHPTMP